MAAVDLCNRALSEIGARARLANFSENSPQAEAARNFYNPMRKLLLRCAPWSFSRKQLALTQVGDAASGTSQFPWNFQYLYPSDCIKLRYLLEIPPNWPFPNTPSVPQTGDTVVFNNFPVSRRTRFLPASGQDAFGNPRKVVLTNGCQAIGVYNYDVVDSTQFDSSFEDSLVALLAERFIMPMTGNVQLKGTFIQIAKDRVMEARVADANEGLPTTDHTPDWIRVRGYAGDSYYSGPAQFGPGIWSESWDSLSWGE